jgi:predicted DNA-binding WGR domain protein
MIIVEQYAYHNREPYGPPEDGKVHDKVWAVAYGRVSETSPNHVYAALWGRRGSRYDDQIKSDMSAAGARGWMETKRNEKLRKGYFSVDFSDPLHGNIPPFGGLLGAAVDLTEETLLADLDVYTQNLKNGLHLEDPDQVQLQLASFKTQSKLLNLGGAIGTGTLEVKQKIQSAMLVLESGIALKLHRLSL